jgi:hypothetical protein
VSLSVLKLIRIECFMEMTYLFQELRHMHLFYIHADSNSVEVISSQRVL